MKIKLIGGFIILILCSLIWFQSWRINELDESLTRTEYNMSQLESDNYSLTFKKGELEDYIKQNNTKFKKDIPPKKVENIYLTENYTEASTTKYNIKLFSIQPVFITAPPFPSSPHSTGGHQLYHCLLWELHCLGPLAPTVDR